MLARIAPSRWTIRTMPRPSARPSSAVKAERGVLICGSGVGASVAANKLPGIRAGLCHDTYSAHQGVEHDDMNVLVLGGRVIGPELAHELVKAYLGATFTGEERHRRRLEKVYALEGRLRALQGCGQSVWLDYIRRSLLTSGELDPPDRRGRPARRHLESGDLRKGDHRQHRLRRDAPVPWHRSTRRPSRCTSRWRSATSRTRPMCCGPSTKQTQAARRLRQPGGLASIWRATPPGRSPRPAGCGGRSTGRTS